MKFLTFAKHTFLTPLTHKFKRKLKGLTTRSKLGSSSA